MLHITRFQFSTLNPTVLHKKSSELDLCTWYPPLTGRHFACKSGKKIILYAICIEMGRFPNSNGTKALGTQEVPYRNVSLYSETRKLGHLSTLRNLLSGTGSVTPRMRYRELFFSKWDTFQNYWELGKSYLERFHCTFKVSPEHVAWIHSTSSRAEGELILSRLSPLLRQQRQSFQTKKKPRRKRRREAGHGGTIRAGVA